MGRQFENVNSQYGSPMGRRSYGREPAPDLKVRLFRVHLDSGGYDDGGAYWGHGEPIFCATDEENYREFTRACTRFEAAALMQLDPAQLARPLTLPWPYSIGREWCGQPEPRFVLRYRGDWLGQFSTATDALSAALDHTRELAGR